MINEQLDSGQKFNTTFLHTSKKGRRTRKPVTLRREGDRIFFLQSDFALKDAIKAMQGSKWHGFQDPPRMAWSIKDSPRNRFQLEYLTGGNPYARFDAEPIEHEYRNPLMGHQKTMTNNLLTYKSQIWAAEMGCIDGEAIVHVNRAGRGFKMTLAKLHEKLTNMSDYKVKREGSTWDSNVPTRVRSMKGEILGLHTVVKSLDKGVKPCLRITLESGKSVVCTHDHEIFTGYESTSRADKLAVGDTAMSNGKWVDKDGYVRVGGLKGKHHRWSTHGVYEHILVAEKKYGCDITVENHVHHKNGIRHDNRPCNLELMCGRQHARMHGKEESFKNLDTAKCKLVPEFDTVVKIEEVGDRHVYDLVMEDPYRNFVADGVIVHNCGKTLSAISAIDHVPGRWFWTGPKPTLPAIGREFKKWNCDASRVDKFTFDGLKKWVNEEMDSSPIPVGLVIDEASRVKNMAAQRTKAIAKLSEAILANGGYVVLMTGTPAPKSPTNWWALAEIACPGFLQEGSEKDMVNRMAFLEEQQIPQGIVMKTKSWRDNEDKCMECGEFQSHPNHDAELSLMAGNEFHKWQPSKNEVAFLYERLKGLATVVLAKDCLDLPEKRYRRIHLEPSPSLKRAAKVIFDTANTAMQAATQLRELSDGFLYQEKVDGTKTCNICDGEKTIQEWFHKTDDEYEFSPGDLNDEDIRDQLEKRTVDCPNCNGSGQMPRKVRFTKQVKCPKDDALRQLLDENEEVGRIVVFAGFTGSVDRCNEICRDRGWSVLQCDGRGFNVYRPDGTPIDVANPLDFWADNDGPVAFVAHPESGGMGLTLVEAKTAVFYSNTFKSEFRSQSEARIHRLGADFNRGCEIVDLLHLPTDEKVLDTVMNDRRLELLTLGEFKDEFEGSLAT